jgi:hypothetical protein
MDNCDEVLWAAGKLRLRTYKPDMMWELTIKQNTSFQVSWVKDNDKQSTYRLTKGRYGAAYGVVVSL